MSRNLKDRNTAKPFDNASPQLKVTRADQSINLISVVYAPIANWQPPRSLIPLPKGGMPWSRSSNTVKKLETNRVRLGCERSGQVTLVGLLLSTPIRFISEVSSTKALCRDNS